METKSFPSTPMSGSFEAPHSAGSAPALFGPTEPTALAWDTRALTTLCRDRAPRSSWLVLAGVHRPTRTGARRGGQRAFCGCGCAEPRKASARPSRSR
ncbi:DUF6177 family protein [Nocardiopsis synnemataformans]|uniref:DUF6177 family protein n=1 Tax=Nocardiopsis synnemataformans TaxID=61305 RepID=UPI003EBB87EC